MSKKMHYVTWAIEVWADTPLDAAKEALTIQRDPESIATAFEVDGELVDLLIEGATTA